VAGSWRTWARVSWRTGRERKRVVRTRIPGVPSLYNELLTTVGGSGVTVSSSVPAPSGTSTSRVTRALFGYTVTAATRLGTTFTSFAAEAGCSLSLPGVTGRRPPRPAGGE